MIPTLPTPTVPLPETVDLPDLKDADAVLAAVREISVVDQSGFSIFKTIGEAISYFDDQTDNTKYTYAGAITVNGAYLQYLPDSTYFFDLDLTNNTSSPIFDENIQWEVEGGNGYPYMKRELVGWPDVLGISSPRAINTDEAFELRTDEVNFADTSIFQIAGPDGLVYVEKGGDDVSHTFSSDELKTLGTGLGIMQISAFQVNDTIINDDKVYYLLGNTYFVTVNIQ